MDVTSSLTIKENQQGKARVVELIGTLDGHTFVELEQRVRELLDDSQYFLVFNLSGLTYVASAGVGVFINCQQQVGDKGGCLQLVEPAPVVKEVFDILGLQALFNIHPDVATAVAAIPE